MPLTEGAYSLLPNNDKRNFAAASSAIFLVAYYLIALGYFLGLDKSILFPTKVVPYLGFRVDSEHQAFRLLLAKRDRFLSLVRDILSKPKVTAHTLQRLVGKCVAFSLAVPAAKLFTREMNVAISRGLRSARPLPLTGALKTEISHWLFLQDWDEPLPWRQEKHITVSMFTDASATGWGGTLLSPIITNVSDYWVGDECSWDIATKEAFALDRMLLAHSDSLRDSRVDVYIDNQAVIHAWNNQGGRGAGLNNALKKIFFTTMELNVALRLIYVPTGDNLAYSPSRRPSYSDSRLSRDVGHIIQREFGGSKCTTFVLMVLD